MDYIRPYVRGAVTTPGYIVVCVPGIPAVEVTEALAAKITEFVVKKEYERARELVKWFSEDSDVKV